MKNDTTDLPEKVMKLVQQTHHNVFLTGKAGTGKTTLLKKIIDTTHKNAAVVAPTGIAALNAGGVTIHSFFQIAPAAYVPDPHFRPLNSGFQKIESLYTLSKVFTMSAAKREVIRNLELLIIDEVSMLRADLLDAIDFVLRKIRYNQQPFGGVQVLFIGDLYQLPPVVKPEEWEVLQRYYSGMFFFQAMCLRNNMPVYIELKIIYRQSDKVFIGILNNLRNNHFKDEDKKVLNAYVHPSFQLLDNPGHIFLTTHNYKADNINNTALQRLHTPDVFFKAEITGEFPDKLFPMEEVLILRKGAQVMFTKNDISGGRRYFNGKIGKISYLGEDEIVVSCEGDDATITVDKYEWLHKKYEVNENTKEIEEKVLGSFVHFPLKLAWAITVHKSQGLTFDKAVIDVVDVFQPGQAYVALSRLRSLDGLVLKETFDVPPMVASSDIKTFSDREPEEEQLKQFVEQGSKSYILQYLLKTFDLTEGARVWKKYVTENAQEPVNSPAGKYVPRIRETLIAWENVSYTASQFSKWLKLYFVKDEDKNILREKIKGAFQHFFGVLDPMEENLLTWMTEISFVKRSKTLFNEMAEIEDVVLTQILRMYKSVYLTETWVAGDEPDKNRMEDDFFKTYRNKKLEKVRQKVKDSRLYADDDFVGVTATKKKKKTTLDKTPSHEITFSFWKQNKSLEEIAKERTLSYGTICSHFTTLLREDKVKLEDILSPEKIKLIKQKMKLYKGEDSLTEIKNYIGGTVSYEELRWYREKQSKF